VINPAGSVLDLFSACQLGLPVARQEFRGQDWNSQEFGIPGIPPLRHKAFSITDEKLLTVLLTGCMKTPSGFTRVFAG